MKKIPFITLALAVFTLLSCSQMVGGSGMYYMQQQKDAGKDDSIGGPTVDWEDDGDGSTEQPALESGQINMFSAYQKDGKVYNNISKPEIKAALEAKLGKSFLYNTSEYENWKLMAKFSAANVPEMWYSGTVSWSGSVDSWQNYKGSNSSAGPNSITDMNYLRAVGYNPFFAIDSSYNTAEYAVYEEATDTKKTETIMKRFHFYRFTGKGGGVAALDNYLVAVDTYTKLVFSFAKPTKWGTLLGNAVPLEWGPVDLVSTGPGGAKYKFYEYDPAGYVTEDGTFVMTDDYKNNLASGNYDPVFTGKSPYLGILDTENGVSGGGGETGYKVSGTLTVKAKYIKNVSMTDAWGDHGNADGTDKPEFIYSVRSRAYAGFEPGDWNVMSAYKPDETDIMPMSATTIQKGTSLQLGGGKQYAFEDVTEGLTLELDSRIIEIDISGNDAITEFEEPIIFLSYDRYGQVWTPITDNGTFLIGPSSYDKNFEVGIGETKDFIVTLEVPNNQKIELCYEVSWQSSNASEAGKIFSAYLKNAGSGYDFSGSRGEYTIEYTDLTQETADKPKTVMVEITLGNLEASTPIILDYSIDNKVSRFVEKIYFGENQDSHRGIISADNPTIKVEIELGQNPTLLQESLITLSLKDESGLNVYDTTNSPSEFKLTVIRNNYVEVDNAQFIISNMKLKNLSLMDIGGDVGTGGAGGYDEPEFAWNIKTRHNTSSWHTMSNYSGAMVIKVGNTGAISGTSYHSIERPREGSQTISISANIFEKDTGNNNEVLMQHEKPLIQLSYVPYTDSWELAGETNVFYSDGSDMRWHIKKIAMDELKRSTDDENNKQTVTVSISSYVHDLIWPIGNIADVINGWKTAGWGDMELTFDVEWK